MSSGRRRGHYDMALETWQASSSIAAPAEAVFAVLADPSSHPAIDGPGWVSKVVDIAPRTGSGQMFRAVTLTYDWTAVPPFLREHITFPPFPVDHLTNSLRHLAELVDRPQPMAFRYAVAERTGNRRAPLGQSMSSRV